MGKVIQDPVHGAISLDGIYQEMLDRPEMQRLRGVKQLGLGTMIFPGANHTRFEHCLGAYHLAGRMSDAIHLSNDDSSTVRMAGLLHDICHAPFSHTLESFMEMETGMGHMDLARALIFGKVPYFRDCDSDLFDGMGTMAEAMEREGISPEKVCDLIAYPETVGMMVLEGSLRKHEYFPSNDYAHQIIHGPVDCDQMDYLMRDAHHTGVCHGRIDCDRLIQTMAVVNDRIVLNRGGVTAAEGLMVSRSLMFTTVYMHEANRIAQRMLIKAVSASDGDMSDIYLLGDMDLQARLEGAGGQSSRMARMIRSRILYKNAFAVYTEEMDDATAEALMQYAGRDGAGRLEREIADSAGIDPMDVCVEVTSKTNLQGKLSIGKTDVSIVDDSGKVRSIVKYSPIARALQSRDPYGWAAIVACPKSKVEAVNRAARKTLGLRSAFYHAYRGQLGHLGGQPCIAHYADDIVHILVRIGRLFQDALVGPVPQIDPFGPHLVSNAVHCQR